MSLGLLGTLSVLGVVLFVALVTENIRLGMAVIPSILTSARSTLVSVVLLSFVPAANNLGWVSLNTPELVSIQAGVLLTFYMVFNPN